VLSAAFNFDQAVSLCPLISGIVTCPKPNYAFKVSRSKSRNSCTIGSSHFSISG
jgi:hypothetical protein